MSLVVLQATATAAPFCFVLATHRHPNHACPQSAPPKQTRQITVPWQQSEKLEFRMHSWLFFLQTRGRSQVLHLLFVLSSDGLSCRIAGPLMQPLPSTFSLLAAPRHLSKWKPVLHAALQKDGSLNVGSTFLFPLKGKLWANLSYASLGQGLSHIKWNGSSTRFNVSLLSFVLTWGTAAS